VRRVADRATTITSRPRTAGYRRPRGGAGHPSICPGQARDAENRAISWSGDRHVARWRRAAMPSWRRHWRRVPCFVPSARFSS
jgi:hypothetical protein